jgi:lysophospholipase L1-like esterase
MQEDGPQRRTRVLGVIVLIGMSLALSAIVGEVALRLRGYRGAPMASMKHIVAVDDPVLDWRRAAHAEYQVGNVIYRFNASGFRDSDHPEENSAARPRIVVVGDSVTEGYAVRWEEVFTRQLQLELEDHDVINVAANGINTLQEVHLLEVEGLRYRPNLVILNFVLNDIDFSSSFRAGQEFDREADSKIGILNLRVDPRLKMWLKSSALIYFVKEAASNLVFRFSSNDEHANYYSRLWSSDENRQKASRGFDQLRALADRNGFEVIVLIWPLMTNFDEYVFAEIHSWVAQQARQRDFATLDLLDSYRGIPYRELQTTSEDSVHPNGRGHRIAMEAFVDWYRQSQPAGAGAGAGGP